MSPDISNQKLNIPVVKLSHIMYLCPNFHTNLVNLIHGGYVCAHKETHRLLFLQRFREDSDDKNTSASNFMFKLVLFQRTRSDSSAGFRGPDSFLSERQ